MKKKIAAGIVVSLLITTSVNVFATDTTKYKNQINENNSKLNELTEEKKEIQDRKSEINSELKKVIEEINALSNEVSLLNNNISNKEAGIAQKVLDIQAMESRIIELEEDIKVQNEEIRGQEEELAIQEGILSDRVRAAYKFNSFGSIIFTLLESTSIVDFTERLMFIEKMAAKDREVMDIIDGIILDLEERRTELEVSKQESEAVKVKLDTEKTELENEKAALENEKAAVTNKLSEQKTLEDQKRSLIANMTQEEQELASSIGDIMDENAALEAEIQKVIREAEERARREEEAKKKEEANNSSSGSVVSSSGYVRPTSGRISSPYGYRIHPIYGVRRMHTGVDYAAPSGTPVVSIKSGTVILRKYNSSYGNYIIVDHGGGVSSLYAHLSGFAISYGQSVKQGQTIGYVGSTGASTGPHLHFEIRINGQHTNPANYVR
ncbi:peptidoglycan DD-metalloendopeptidase family protein [Proteiniclasticum sp. SCR006]|uniref:Peptidoglycan DD-metalloendopeptidase family protein n=1 Tax=Proteiniclasticum aestuarii TaxID=2817862 RepID=A0A939H468_9CLOT|nr:M23 family metallopeptidase [Proteiniclasticum aestuarii]MBO1263814.1 peptidoglycan DD-metalloendopeptidase family protein [Proteiniclasticum aestuarii]